MDIKTLASGSTGNAYLVSDGTTTLLLECGIPYKALMQRSGYRLSLLDACLVTHEHADHARAAHDLLAVGIPLYCSAGTADALHITTTPGARPVLRHLCAVSIGTMTVLPVSVCHDAAEPLGWSIVSTADCTRLVFLTDTSRA
ncbi:MAG: MBL fold metallo-hydrolase, partial [Ruthenibacterium sp.]